MNDQQFNLFEFNDEPNLTHPEINFYPCFFDIETSDRLYQQLRDQILWRQDYIKMYGKKIPIPRLTAWYGERDKFYTYSGIKMESTPWIEPLLFIKKEIEAVANTSFNSVLLNLYRDGKDGVAWHSDDEPELGTNPIIGSVSLGATRRFLLKPKDKTKSIKHSLNLTHGSFLLMSGETQKNWLHQVPKTTKPVNPRINLTFRYIYN